MRGSAWSDPARRSFFYVARNEIGWISKAAGYLRRERIPVKDLGDVYNAVDDSAGSVWVELGVARVGRIEFARETQRSGFYALRKD